MQRTAELGLGQTRTVDVVAVGLVDNNAVSHLHDAALDALKFVARACKLDQQEEVDHRMDGSLALTYADSLYKYIVVARRLTEHNRFAGLAGHSAERTGRRAGTDERRRMDGEFLHPRLVAEYRSLGALARRIDGEHREFAAVAQHMQAEHINRRTLACTGHTGDAYSARAARKRQTLLDHFLGYGLMVGAETLDKRDRPAEHSHIALQYALDKLRRRRQRFAFGTFVKVWVDRRRLCHAAIDRQPDILLIIFRMLHILLTYYIDICICKLS